VLGAGTFGRVKLVRHTPTGTPYALKILQKAQVVDFKQTKNVMNEKNVMAMIDHPFILKLAATFMDANCLCVRLVARAVVVACLKCRLVGRAGTCCWSWCRVASCFPCWPTQTKGECAHAVGFDGCQFGLKH